MRKMRRSIIRAWALRARVSSERINGYRYALTVLAVNRNQTKRFALALREVGRRAKTLDTR